MSKPRRKLVLIDQRSCRVKSHVYGDEAFRVHKVVNCIGFKVGEWLSEDLVQKEIDDGTIIEIIGRR